jgi:acetyl esterase/lipase
LGAKVLPTTNSPRYIWELRLGKPRAKLIFKATKKQILLSKQAFHPLMQSLSTRLMLSLATAGLLLAASCKNNDSNGIAPSGNAPAWGPSIGKEMLAVIEELDSLHPQAIETVSPPVARMQPTIFDAQKSLAARYGIPGTVFTTDAADRSINVNNTMLSIRVYTPHTGAGPFAGIVYFHGGGFVVSDLKTYDGSARSLAEQTGAVVVNVDYRRGPESKFPTAYKDAYAAYKWILANAASLNIDMNRIALAGEGGGGNIACNVSMMARDSGVTMPRHQLLIYPFAQNDTTTASYQKYAMAQPLSRILAGYFLRSYLNSWSQTADTRISLINANLSGLPATTIINAEIDPLRDDGLMLEAKLKSYGVAVSRRIFDGVTHDFYGLSLVVPQARDAEGFATQELLHSLQ